MSKRVLVNLRGCNGAGKSTIPMSMMDDPCMFVQEVKSGGKTISRVTVFPTYGWVALGTYFNKTGGLDTLKNNDITRKTLLYAIKIFPEYDILMEGIMASTIRSTYIDLFHEVENSFKGIQVMIISLLPPCETAIARVYKRNGGKPVNEEAIQGKWKTVQRNVRYFADEGFVSVRVDSSKVSKENMLKAFHKTVEKYRL